MFILMFLRTYIWRRLEIHRRHCNEFYYGEYIRHLNIRIGKQIGISTLTEEQVKPKGSAVSDHMLLCNHWPLFDSLKSIVNEINLFKLTLDLRQYSYSTEYSSSWLHFWGVLFTNSSMIIPIRFLIFTLVF